MANAFFSAKSAFICIAGAAAYYFGSSSSFTENLYLAFTHNTDKSHHLHLPQEPMTNKDLLAAVDMHLGRSLEEMQRFVRREMTAHSPRTIQIRGQGGSILTGLLKIMVIAMAGYGLLRVSGYPVNNLLGVSRTSLAKLVAPLTQRVATLREAAEEGFEEVLHMVKNYTEELRDMREEIQTKMTQLEANVREVQTNVGDVEVSLGKLDNNMAVTLQGMRLICTVAEQHLPPPSAMPGPGVDSHSHRQMPQLQEAPRNPTRPLPSATSSATAPARTPVRQDDNDAKARITDIISAGQRPTRPATKASSSPQDDTGDTPSRQPPQTEEGASPPSAEPRKPRYIPPGRFPPRA